MLFTNITILDAISILPDYNIKGLFSFIDKHTLIIRDWNAFPDSVIISREGT